MTLQHNVVDFTAYVNMLKAMAGHNKTTPRPKGRILMSLYQLHNLERLNIDFYIIRHKYS
tara:strand:+ start:11875 stop:12054 length:180 start_codon:yes stop_codon:yes gene_type:complete